MRRAFKEKAETNLGNVLLELQSPAIKMEGIFLIHVYFAKQQRLGFYIIFKIHKLLNILVTVAHIQMCPLCSSFP